MQRPVHVLLQVQVVLLFYFFALSVSWSPIGVNQVFAREILRSLNLSCPEYFYPADPNKFTHRDKSLANKASYCYSENKIHLHGITEE